MLAARGFDAALGPTLGVSDFLSHIYCDVFSFSVQLGAILMRVFLYFRCCESQHSLGTLQRVVLLRSYSAWDDASSALSRLSEVPRLPSVDSPPP
jgi:hypothetical protein